MQSVNNYEMVNIKRKSREDYQEVAVSNKGQHMQMSIFLSSLYHPLVK